MTALIFTFPLIMTMKTFRNSSINRFPSHTCDKLTHALHLWCLFFNAYIFLLNDKVMQLGLVKKGLLLGCQMHLQQLHVCHCSQHIYKVSVLPSWISGGIGLHLDMSLPFCLPLPVLLFHFSFNLPFSLPLSPISSIRFFLSPLYLLLSVFLFTLLSFTVPGKRGED